MVQPAHPDGEVTQHIYSFFPRRKTALTVRLEKHVATAVVVDIDRCFALYNKIPHRTRLGLKEWLDTMITARTRVAGRALPRPVDVPVAVWICTVAILAAAWRYELAGCMRLEVGSVA